MQHFAARAKKDYLQELTMMKPHIPAILTFPNRIGINFIASDVGDTVNFAEKLQSSQSIPFRIKI